MPRRVTTFCTLILAAALYTGNPGAPGRAWATGLQPAAPNGNADAERKPIDVYVNDSFAAGDALEKAGLLAGQRRWIEAAELLQRTADSEGERLIRVGPELYVGVRRRINAIISGWPAAGIAAYRSVYEPRIQAELEGVARSHSPSRLLELFDRFFCTASAVDLADAIAQLAVEAGDFRLAEHVYRRILQNHPDRSSHAQRIRAMLAVLSAIQGREPESDVENDVPITWMGREQALSNALADVAARFAEVRQPMPPSDWPVFAGNAARNRAASTDVDELGLLWRFDDFDGVAAEEADLLGEGAAPDARGRDLSMFPVVSDGLVFAQRGREIIALHLATGRLAWRFRDQDADESGLKYVGHSAEGGPRWESVTVEAGRLYASLPSVALPFSNYDREANGAEIVCLRAGTGELVWRVDHETISEPFAHVTFDSSPVVQTSRLYVVGRRRRSFGFEDCYVYRFNAEDGRLEERTHLGSASTGTFGSRHASKAILALQGDTVYVSTNLGTVAAVGAFGGGVRWLRRYERDRFQSAGGSSRVGRDERPWQLNPVIYSAGRIIVLPTDATDLMVLDAQNGVLSQRIGTEQLGGAESLLAVSGDSLYTAGREVCRYELSTHNVRWSAPLPETSAIFGRGALLGDRILIPGRERLWTFQAADGQRGEASWGPETEGGNILCLPEHLVVAGVSRISAYVRKAQIWTALRARMAADPTDPVPALELAEIALNNAEVSEALSDPATAVERVKPMNPPAEKAIVRRIFNDTLAFANRLAERDELEPDTLDVLFKYAAEHAQDARDHLRYRFELARLFERQDRPEKAARLYQQVLKDRSLRERAADFSPRGTALAEASGSLAGHVAETRIDALIARYGRSVYAPFEEEARTWLTRGTADNDAAVYEKVVETFPNSRAAPLALMALGDLKIKQGDPLEATKAYARCFHRYDRQIDRPELLKKIADAYEQGGKPERAYLWLTKAVREHPDAYVEEEGRSMTFREYRKRLDDVRDRVEPSRPRVRLPLSADQEIESGDEAILLSPRFADAPLSDWSRFFVYTPPGIRAYDARTGKQAWDQAAEVRKPPELLMAGPDLAVFATLYEVFGLDVETGARRWSYGEYPNHVDEIEGDWEDAAAFCTHALDGRRLVSARDDGQFVCLDVGSGEVLWTRIHRPHASGLIRFAEPWIAYPVTQDGQAVIVVLDAGLGEWSGAIMTGENRAVEDTFITLDGGIVIATTRAVSCYDAETGRRKWRVHVGGRLRRASVLLDFDALYFSDDGEQITKISLQDGRTLWESESLAPRGSDDLTIQRVDSSVIVSTGTSVAAVDAVTGLTLWQGATDERPRFAFRLLSDVYLAAVDVAGGFQESPGTAYFYDHRNGSGRIASDGGTLKLGRLHEVRNALLVRDALVVQDAGTVHVWRHE